MKNLALLFLLSTLILPLAACSKAPTEELAASQTAIDAVVSEGAEKFTPEDLKLVQDALIAAQGEMDHDARRTLAVGAAASRTENTRSC